MRRVLAVVFLSTIFQATIQSLALNFPLWMNLFFIPPLVLVFSLQFFKPWETIFIAFWCGAITDILGGFPIGFNMALSLGLIFFASSIKAFGGRLLRNELVYYVMIASFIYRLVLQIAYLIYTRGDTNIFIVHLLLGPIIDGVISILFYSLLVRVLCWIKVFDHNDYYKDRIGLKS